MGAAVTVVSQYLHRSRWLYGTFLSIGIAVVLILVERGSRRSSLVPVVFIGVVALCARYFGFLAGVLGAIGASSLFDLYLFEPYGSLKLRSGDAAVNLGLLLFVGIALSYASARSRDTSGPHRSL